MTEMWTTKDVQARYRVCRTTVWRWVTYGGCPCMFSIGGRMTFVPAEVESWYMKTSDKIAEVKRNKQKETI